MGRSGGEFKGQWKGEIVGKMREQMGARCRWECRWEEMGGWEGGRGRRLTTNQLASSAPRPHGPLPVKYFTKVQCGKFWK